MEKLEFKGTSREWAIGRGLKIQTDPNDPMRTITIAQVFGSDALEINQANAHLIAAAPDLLEACIADVRNMYDGEEHVGYQVDGMNGRVLCTFELTEFDHACQYVENLRKAAISKALNTTSNEG